MNLLIIFLCSMENIAKDSIHTKFTIFNRKIVYLFLNKKLLERYHR